MRFGPPIPLLSCLLLTGAGPSGGGQGLQAPTDFGVNEYENISDVSLSFGWSPPLSGPLPDAYRFVFTTDSLGTVELIGSDVVAALDGIPFNAYWTANVWSRLLTQESESSAFLYGTTTAGSYP